MRINHFIFILSFQLFNQKFARHIAYLLNGESRNYNTGHCWKGTDFLNFHISLSISEIVKRGKKKILRVKHLFVSEIQYNNYLSIAYTFAEPPLGDT